MVLSYGMPRCAVRAGLTLALFLPAVAAADPLPVSPALTQPTVTEVGGKTLAQWTADLKDKDPSVREEAIRAIVLFPDAGKAVPALIDRLSDTDASPRSKAVMALGLIRIDDKDKPRVVEALGARLTSDGQAPIRYDAAVSLAALGQDARGALNAILTGIEDQSSFEIRKACISAAMQAGETKDGPEPRVTRALLMALNDRASEVRLQALMAMANMGHPDDPMLIVHELKTLRDLTADKDKCVAIWAHLSVMALDKVNDADIDFLLKCAKPEETLRVRLQSIGALGAVGSKAPAVTPTLIDFLGDKDPQIVGSACMALATLGDPGLAAETALFNLAAAPGRALALRQQAIGTLGFIGHKSKTVVKPLVTLLGEKDPDVVIAACNGLGYMGDPGTDAEKALADLVQSRDADAAVRQAAAGAIEAIKKAKKK